MVQEATSNRETFIEKVKDSVRRAESHTTRLRALHLRLLVVGTLSSAGTTLVAGITAALGPVVGQGVEGWRFSCIIAAILGFAATFCIGLNQQLGIADRLSVANQSLGRLKYLDMTITTGSREWDEITKEYLDIVQHFPEALD